MYPNTHTTTMQTRSQTRNLSNIDSNTNLSASNYSIQTRSRTNASPVQSPRQTPTVIFEEEATFEDTTILDAEFTEYDSSSDYDPNEEYSVDIDFDEASNAWRANKHSTGNGTFVYTKNAFRENTVRTNTENTHPMTLRTRVSNNRW